MNLLLHSACLLAVLAAVPSRMHAAPRRNMTDQQKQALRQQAQAKQQQRQSNQQQPQEEPAQQTPADWADTGTFEGSSGNVIMIKNANGQPWKIEVGQQTTVAVEGTAEPSYLRPKVFVHFNAELDEKQAVKGDIAELDVYTPENKKDFGLFTGADTKPVTKPAAGNYNVKGKVVSLKGETLTVMAGNKKVTGKLSPAAKIKVKVSELDLAQPGDAIKVTGWTVPNQPQHARASDMKVTMAKPLVGKMKKAKMGRNQRGNKKGSSETQGTFGFGDTPSK